MKKYEVTICFYGRTRNEPEHNRTSIIVESDSPVHAVWKAASVLGIQQYYADWAIEVN